LDKILGLKKGTSAPHALEIDAIFLLSVDTIILVNNLLFFNFSIVAAIVGLPLNFL